MIHNQASKCLDLQRIHNFFMFLSNHNWEPYIFRKFDALHFLLSLIFVFLISINKSSPYDLRIGNTCGAWVLFSPIRSSIRRIISFSVVGVRLKLVFSKVHYLLFFRFVINSYKFRA